MWKFGSVIGTLLVCATCATSTANHLAGEQRLDNDVVIVPIGEGLWVHRTMLRSRIFGDVLVNGLILQSGAEALVVDTGWSEEQGATIRTFVTKTLNLHISEVILTHSHVDRIGGAKNVLAPDVTLIAHPQTLISVGKWPVQDKLPVVDAATFALGDEVVEVFYPGPAHSPDNTVVWIPRHHLLFGGCLIRAPNGPQLGNTFEADMTRWPRAIELVQQRFAAAKVVIPGHGDVGGTELFHYSRKVLSEAEQSRPSD